MYALVKITTTDKIFHFPQPKSDKLNYLMGCIIVFMAQTY